MNMMCHILSAVLAVVFTGGVAAQPPAAFPGAVGYGAQAKGGRGGRIIHVTSLKDAGPGSLREAVNDTGARIVMFRTGGLITLKSSLVIGNPFITIAGQSAPGGGICLRSAGTRGMNMVVVSTHDVVIRYLRFRRGPSTDGGECNGDNLTLINADRCTFDHCSFSWGTDELVNTWPATNVTFQWCIFSEALKNSTHSDNCDPEGPRESHAFGPLCGEKSKNITFFANLFVDNTGRNPQISPTEGGRFQLVNNVVYNVCYAMTLEGRNGNRIEANAIGNFIKQGPNSCENNRNNILFAGSAKGYLEGNITPFRNSDDPQWNASSEFMKRTPADAKFKADAPFDTPPIRARDALKAYSDVIDSAGACIVADSMGRFFTARDPVDERACSHARSGTARKGTHGRHIDHPSDAGGWPQYANGTPYTDADRDGMADAWEKQWGLDPKNDADCTDDPDGDGYTNLEEFLNRTKPREKPTSAGHPAEKALHAGAKAWQVVYGNPDRTGDHAAAYDIFGRPIGGSTHVPGARGRIFPAVSPGGQNGRGP